MTIFKPYNGIIPSKLVLFCLSMKELILFIVFYFSEIFLKEKISKEQIEIIRQNISDQTIKKIWYGSFTLPLSQMPKTWFNDIYSLLLKHC